MAETIRRDLTWVYPTVEISQDQRVPRPAVGRRYASELTGFDGSVSGGLRPASGFEHIHTLDGFTAADVDTSSNHDETSVNHGIWPVTFVMKDANKSAFGFVYRMARKAGATTCDIFLDYYNAECGAWNTVLLVDGAAINYADSDDSPCSTSGSIVSSTPIEVTTFGMLLYVFVKGRTPYRFYLKKCGDLAYLNSGSATCAEGYAGTATPLAAATATLTVGGQISASTPGGTIHSIKIVDGAGTTQEYHGATSGNPGDLTKAKMDFTFDNTAPANDQTITIISTDGTSKTFIAKSSVTDGTLDGSNVVFSRDGVGASNHAASFITAVTHANGLGSKVTCTQGGGKVTIEQAVGGFAGNSTITKSASFTTADAPPATFTGGGCKYINTGTTNAAHAYNLEQAIKSSGGHAGQILVTRAAGSNVLTLKQKRKGTSGNTTMVSTGTSNITLTAQFSGGAGTYCNDGTTQYENLTTPTDPPGPGAKPVLYSPPETDPYVALSINTERHDSSNSAWGKVSIYDTDPIKTWDLRWKNKTKGYYEELNNTPPYHTILNVNETTGFTDTLSHLENAYFFIGIAHGTSAVTGSNLSDKTFKLRDSNYTIDGNVEDAYNTASFWFNNSSAYTTAHTNDTHYALPTQAQSIAGPTAIDCTGSEAAEDGVCPSMSMISVQNIETVANTTNDSDIANYRIMKAIQNSINNATNLDMTAVPFLTGATSTSKPASNGTAASGSITIASSIDVSELNGETIILVDSSGTSTTFTWDTSVATETGTNIGISGISDADEGGVATRLLNTINNYYASNDEGITATTTTTGVVTLTQKLAGAQGNTVITSNSASAEISATSNFSGGNGDYFLKISQNALGTNGHTPIDVNADLENEAGVYFLSTATVHSDNLLATNDTLSNGGAASGNTGTFTRTPIKLEAGNYTFSVQFVNSFTKLRSGLSEIAQMSTEDFRGYGVNPNNVTDGVTAYDSFSQDFSGILTTVPTAENAGLFVGLHLQYDSLKWDQAYIYRSVKTETAGGTFSSSVMHLDNVITLEDHRIMGPADIGGNPTQEDSAMYPLWQTCTEVGSEDDCRYRQAVYFYELDDKQLIFQDVYTDKTIFDEKMPFGGAAIMYENTLLVSNIDCTTTTTNNSSSQQFRNLGEVRWSSLYEPSPELFPVSNYYVPEASSNPIIRFEKTGANVIGFARDKIYHLRKQSTNIGGYMKISEMHEGYGIVNEHCAASVGTSVYFITHKGLKSIDARGQLDDVKGVDYLLMHEWRSYIRNLRLSFDAQMGALFILNPDTKEAAIFWFNTGRITRYKDLPFDFTRSGFFPYSLEASLTGSALTTAAATERDERAFFVQNYPYTGDGSGDLWNASDATFSSTKWAPRIYRYRFERDSVIASSTASDTINGSNRITTLLYPGDTRFTVHALAAAGSGVDDNVFIISLSNSNTDYMSTGGNAFRPRPISTEGSLNWVGSYVYILSNPGTTGAIGDKAQVLKVTKAGQAGADGTYDQIYIKFDSSTSDANAMKSGTRIGLSPVYTRFIAHPVITTSSITGNPLEQASDYHKTKHIDSIGASIVDISSPIKGFTAEQHTPIDDSYLLGVFQGNDTAPVSSAPPKDFNGDQVRSFLDELGNGIWVPIGDGLGVQSQVLSPFFSSFCPDVDFRLLSLVADGKIASTYTNERRDA